MKTTKPTPIHEDTWEDLIEEINHPQPPRDLPPDDSPMRAPSREIRLSENLSRAEWLAACEAAEQEWLAKRLDPDRATLDVTDVFAEWTDKVWLDATTSATVGVDLAFELPTGDVEIIGTVDCADIRRALNIPRWIARYRD